MCCLMSSGVFINLESNNSVLLCLAFYILFVIQTRNNMELLQSVWPSEYNWSLYLKQMRWFICKDVIWILPHDVLFVENVVFTLRKKYSNFALTLIRVAWTRTIINSLYVSSLDVFIIVTFNLKKYLCCINNCVLNKEQTFWDLFRLNERSFSI